MLARQVAQPKAASRPTVLRFALDGAQLAVPAQLVREVITVAAYAALPCESPAHLGMILHRDRVIPLVDLGAQLKIHDPGTPHLPCRCLILKSRSGDIACPVDEAYGLVQATDEWLARQTILPGDVIVLDAEAKG